jgi:hypothetical protein
LDCWLGDSLFLDCEHSLNNGHHPGILIRNMFEERPDRCQANVPGPDAVAPLNFQAFEEGKDGLTI